MNNQATASAAIFSIILCAGLVCPAAPDDQYFASVFKKVMPRIEEAADEMHESQSLPDRALFGKDKRDVQQDINKLLDKAIDVLELSTASDVREDISKIENRIAADLEDLDACRRKQISAREGAILGIQKLPFATTKKGYEERIEAIEGDIAERKQELEELKRTFQEELAKLGLQLTPDQVNQLLSTVEGDQFIELTIVFDNVKQVTLKLQDLMTASAEDTAASRRYYGMYVILLQVLDRIQQTYISEIDEGHLPKLDEYEKEADDIIKDARRLLETVNDTNRQHLEMNIKSAGITKEAISLYRMYLKKQRETVVEMNTRLQQDIGTAENTYRTVTLSTNLAALLQQGIDRFKALTQLSPPTLVVFQSDAVEAEFRRLTEKMKK